MKRQSKDVKTADKGWEESTLLLSRRTWAEDVTKSSEEIIQLISLETVYSVCQQCAWSDIRGKNHRQQVPFVLACTLSLKDETITAQSMILTS